MEKKNKKATVIIISICIVLILAIIISYAYFTTELNGANQIVKVGTLDLVLDETSEGISLDNAIGISDSDGLSLDGSTFKLINNGSKAVDYTIYLDDNTIEETDTRIDDKYLKYNLNKNGKDSGATLLTRIGSNPNRILDSGTIEGKSTNEYSLILWITDEVDGNYSGQVFSGKLRVEVSQERDKSISTVLLENIPEENLYDDGTDTFITGEEPDNYIWYSGKLWRAVLVNNEEKTVKLVTQWNISAIPYSSGSSAFEGSYMEEWLNDTTVDGFLGNLREPDKFIVMDSVWDATMDATALGIIQRPDGTTTVIAPVGLLNMYEYQESFRGTTYGEGYLNNELQWWLITPDTLSEVWQVNSQQDGNGNTTSYEPKGTAGIRPSIVLKSNIKIIDGDGTENNPYRLEGDNDTDLSGTLLSSRYSGEYMTFGNDENNLYRIVSHETSGLTKITSAEPLKSSGTFITSAFSSESSDRYYSSSNVIGTFLNKDYLNSYVDSSYNEMIEESTTWYLGKAAGENYKLAKYTNTDMVEYAMSTDAKIGLLRMGELMSGQFTYSENNTTYWLLTLNNTDICVRTVFLAGNGSFNYTTKSFGIKPSLNLKSNVIITGGDGTKNNPFTLSVQ